MEENKEKEEQLKVMGENARKVLEIINEENEKQKKKTSGEGR